MESEPVGVSPVVTAYEQCYPLDSLSAVENALQVLSVPWKCDQLEADVVQLGFVEGTALPLESFMALTEKLVNDMDTEICEGEAAIFVMLGGERDGTGYASGEMLKGLIDNFGLKVTSSNFERPPPPPERPKKSISVSASTEVPAEREKQQPWRLSYEQFGNLWDELDVEDIPEPAQNEATAPEQVSSVRSSPTVQQQLLQSAILSQELDEERSGKEDSTRQYPKDLLNTVTLTEQEETLLRTLNATTSSRYLNNLDNYRLGSSLATIRLMKDAIRKALLRRIYWKDYAARHKKGLSATNRLTVIQRYEAKEAERRQLRDAERQKLASSEKQAPLDEAETEATVREVSPTHARFNAILQDATASPSKSDEQLHRWTTASPKKKGNKSTQHQHRSLI